MWRLSTYAKREKDRASGKGPQRKDAGGRGRQEERASMWEKEGGSWPGKLG